MTTKVISATAKVISATAHTKLFEFSFADETFVVNT